MLPSTTYLTLLYSVSGTGWQDGTIIFNVLIISSTLKADQHDDNDMDRIRKLIDQIDGLDNLSIRLFFPTSGLKMHRSWPLI